LKLQDLIFPRRLIVGLYGLIVRRYTFGPSDVNKFSAGVPPFSTLRNALVTHQFGSLSIKPTKEPFSLVPGANKEFAEAQGLLVFPTTPMLAILTWGGAESQQEE